MLFSKKNILIASLTALTFISAVARTQSDYSWVKNALVRSEDQLLLAAEKYKTAKKNPRTFENGTVKLAGTNDWTCGFFPGSLWYLYELSKNEQFKTEAIYYTDLLKSVQYRKDTHDLGFMLYCSFGNAYRITGNENYKSVLITGANSLMTRFHPEVGLIKSWDKRINWQYPVIIDNMLNLEFLCEVSKLTKDDSYKSVSVKHADKTLANHFRPDNSCFHVVNYDSINGNVISKETHQGYSNSSSWARGQGWALYGYTMMYRETKDPKYLAQAQKVAGFILHHPNLPKDKIPYWDFNAPNIPNEPRDASAGALYASALIELSTYVKDGTEYISAAEQMLKSLSTAEFHPASVWFRILFVVLIDLLSNPFNLISSIII